MNKIKRLLPICLALLLALSVCGCAAKPGVDTANASSAAGSRSADKAAYQSVISEERISVDAAYEKLNGNTDDNADAQELFSLLQDLRDCSGKFVLVDEETAKRYHAEVGFYLMNGKPQCSVSYDGYLGTIRDGEVTRTEESGFVFQATPIGEMFEREVDFTILFAKDQLRVMWADICDYLLRRETEDDTNSIDDRDLFVKTDLYQTILETVDKRFETSGHAVVYDAENAALNIYVQAPDNSRENLNKMKDAIAETWSKLASSLSSFTEQLLPPLKMGGHVQTVNLYLVDKLNSRNEYSQDEYLIWAQNGTVLYDYAKDGGSAAPAQKPTETASAPPATEPKTTAPQRAATFGEQNALQAAYDYLDVMAFSYTGLIEQLEYEGYSASEAKYGADHCGADWNEQAVKSGREYLDSMAFSSSELYEQLLYEGFTASQAQYAISVIY